MNFHAGDRVRVKTIQELAALYGRPYQGFCGAMVVVPGGFNFTSNMEQYGGTVHMIEKVFAGGYYLSGIAGNYLFTDAMLDRVGE